MKSFSITVGRLLCSQVRYYFDQMKFRGYKIEYLESPGWIEREFTIRGDDLAIRVASAGLDTWMKSLEESEAKLTGTANQVHMDTIK